LTRESEQEQGAKGAVEDLKGRVKESAGALFGDDEARREGRAQQDKADSQQQLAEKETELQQAREKAAIDEERQRREQ